MILPIVLQVGFQPLISHAQSSDGVHVDSMMLVGVVAVLCIL